MWKENYIIYNYMITDYILYEIYINHINYMKIISFTDDGNANFIEYSTSQNTGP